MSKRQIIQDRVKSMILNTLESGCTFTAGELSANAYLNEVNDTYPKARKAIRELINDGNVIGSTKEGYKLLTTGKEVQVYLNSLLKRTIGINNRIQSVYDSAKDKGLL
jgi:hypothetical protein